jgi:hypothetical protein
MRVMFDFEALIPLVGIAAFFGIPIIAILTRHQRKMAELVAGRQQSVDQDAVLRIQRLEAEVASLRDTVNAQVLQNDDLRRSLSQPASPPSVPQGYQDERA